MDPDLHAIVFADPSGRIRYWSPGAERLFGWAARDALGQSLDMIVPPELRERYWEGFHRAMRTGDSKLDRSASNLPMLCRDGEVRVFPARFNFLTDAHGRAAGALAVCGDPLGGEAFGPVPPLASEPAR